MGWEKVSERRYVENNFVINYVLMRKDNALLNVLSPNTQHILKIYTYIIHKYDYWGGMCSNPEFAYF